MFVVLHWLESVHLRLIDSIFFMLDCSSSAAEKCLGALVAPGLMEWAGAGVGIGLWMGGGGVSSNCKLKL